jgi:transglutaminase-like putative cysteine protease
VIILAPVNAIQAARSIERGRFATGTRGTIQTLQRMRQLVHEGTEAPEVIEAASAVIAQSRPASARDALLDLFRFVRDGVRFTPDPAGIEQLQSPRVTLVARTGDCDDKSVLLVALAEALALPFTWKFRVIATRKPWPRRFNHVYPVAEVDGQELPLDPTYRGTPPGWQHPRPLRTGEVTV